MQITITKKRVWSGVGWFLMAIFWVFMLFGAVGLLNSSGNSGIGIIAMFLPFIAMEFWYLLVVPFALFGIGMYRAAKKDLPLFRSVLIWGTVSIASYIFLLFSVIAILLRPHQ